MENIFINVLLLTVLYGVYLVFAQKKLSVINQVAENKRRYLKVIK